MDLLAAVSAWVIFHGMRKEVLGEEPETLLKVEIFANALVISVFWLSLYLISGLYSDIYRKSRIREFFKLIPLNLVGCIIIFFALLLDDEGITTYTGYYKTFGLYFLLHTSFLQTVRILTISYFKSLIRKKTLFFNTLIVGSDKNARELLEELQRNDDRLGYNVVGHVHVFEESVNLLKKNFRHFGNYLNLPKVIRRCRIQHVMIAVEPSEHKKIQEILTILQGAQVTISIIPDIHQLLLGSVKVNYLLDVPLIEINQDLIPLWQKALKRCFDIGFAIFVLSAGFPFFLFIALMTRISSKGPVFYVQERIGRNGKPFQIFKFRSMRTDSEVDGTPALSSEADPRITPWGRIMRKTRLDELPQFYNVLIGDMSLVGPRPERQYFIDQIVAVAPEYLHLQKVRPGITSLGQVKFGYAENVDQMVKRLKYDIFYIENMSLAMDFRIILYTFLIIMQGRGK